MDIFLLLQSNKEGLKAREMAKLLNVDKSDINSCLYSNNHTMFNRHNDYTWTANPKYKTGTVLSQKQIDKIVENAMKDVLSKSSVIDNSKKKAKTTNSEKAKLDRKNQFNKTSRKEHESIPEYIDRMINSFDDDVEDIKNIDITEYIGDNYPEPSFSTDLLRKLRFVRSKKQAELQSLFEEVIGKGKKFREGQEDAILALLEGKHVLVVQRTGWGKSLIYFLTTKYLRKHGGGPTIIVSPLLALMHNQIESADKYGLVMKHITSDTQDEWPKIYKMIEQDKVDVIFLSPERLADEDFQRQIMSKFKNIGLFVVDEAHCISDWGHDFRPNFRLIVKYVKKLPNNTPILATTATANNRVIRDIRHQLGEDLEIQRGSLDRPSIDVDILHLHTDDAKKQWLLRNINKIANHCDGAGIIYCLTRTKCEEISQFLIDHGIKAAYYHARLEKEEKYRLEKEFQENKIKVLVATIAFGMGIDKSNINFVIHYQQPANAVAYYQQIGRAGRGIDHTYAIVLVGDDDNDINAYFISHAFPTEDQLNMIVDYITENPKCSRQDIIDEFDVGTEWANKVLSYLIANGDIYKTNSRYFKTSKKWTCDMKRARIVSKFRWTELREFNEFLASDKCYMEYVRKELDDPKAKPCGHCANCLRKHFFV